MTEAYALFEMTELTTYAIYDSSKIHFGTIFRTSCGLIWIFFHFFFRSLSRFVRQPPGQITVEDVARIMEAFVDAADFELHVVTVPTHHHADVNWRFRTVEKKASRNPSQISLGKMASSMSNFKVNRQIGN